MCLCWLVLWFENPLSFLVDQNSVFSLFTSSHGSYGPSKLLTWSRGKKTNPNQRYSPILAHEQWSLFAGDFLTSV